MTGEDNYTFDGKFFFKTKYLSPECKVKGKADVVLTMMDKFPLPQGEKTYFGADCLIHNGDPNTEPLIISVYGPVEKTLPEIKSKFEEYKNKNLQHLKQ